MNVTDETEWVARIVLQTANRMQAKGSSVRLVVPRAPEITQELESLELPFGDEELLTVEEYLLERDYLAPANIGLTWGTYTITPAGFNWLEGSSPESSPTNRGRELIDEPGEEAASEATLRAELEESRRIEEVERELEEPPEGAAAKPRTSTGGAQTGQERPWWRFWR